MTTGGRKMQEDGQLSLAPESCLQRHSRCRAETGRATTTSNCTPKGPRLLTDEQMKIVWDKNLCLQCL